MEKKTIGAFLAALRKASGMTQRQLAEQLNVSDKAVSRWERDEALPDLTLIPVIAEIFGVTSDELLRGQKSSCEIPSASGEEKSKKRLQNLLNKAKTGYEIRCLISLMLAVLGVIAAAILNLAFLRAAAGFWVGCIFFIAAFVLQAIFCIQTRASLETEDFDPDALSQCRRSIHRSTYWSFALIIVLFAFNLPLLAVEDAYAGLSLARWLIPVSIHSNGSVYTHTFLPQPALLALLAAGLFRIVPISIGAVRKLRPTGKLQLRCIVSVLILLALTMTGHGLLKELLDYNRHWTGQGTAHTSVESFLDFIHTPLTSEGKPYEYTVLFWDSQGNMDMVEYYDESLDQYRAIAYHSSPAWKGQELHYIRLNQTVRYIDIAQDRAAIYTYTDAQLHQANQIIACIIYPLAIVYPLEVLLVWKQYRRKLKALKAAQPHTE